MNVAADQLPANAPPPAGKGASFYWDLVYGLIVVFGFPVLLYRRLFLKKDTEGRRQKLGHVPERPAHPRRIWIHAVSVGEALATNVLVKRLRAECPGCEIVFSTTTQTGQEVARKKHGEDAVFYYPYDFSWAVRRSLDRVKPALIVLMELEVWPNFSAEAVKRGIPLVVVNGRITPRSAERYAKSWILLGHSFRRITRWLMQSDEYALRVKALGVAPERVEVTGNIKYDDVDTEPLSDEDRAEARAMLGIPPDAKVVIGGSTHPSEEGALLAAYRLLLEKHPRLRLVLVPRHPHRLSEVEKEIAAHGFGFVRRSALKAKGQAACDELPEAQRARAVVLVDTMGELKKLYQAADLAFVGGSLIPHGGQNPMEPAGMGLPTLYGPYMQNFGEAVLILKDAEGGVMVDDAAQLHARIETLLADPAAAQAMGARAREAFLKKQGATGRCVAFIRSLLRLDLLGLDP